MSSTAAAELVGDDAKPEADGSDADASGALCNTCCWKGSMMIRRVISISLTVVDVAGTWFFFGSVIPPVEEEPSSSEDEPTETGTNTTAGGQLRRWLEQQQQQQQRRVPSPYFDQYGPALLVFAILSTVVLLAVFVLFLVHRKYSKEQEQNNNNSNDDKDDNKASDDNNVEEGDAGEKTPDDNENDDDAETGAFEKVKNKIKEYARTGNRLYWAQVLVSDLPQFVLTTPFVLQEGVAMGWALFNYVSSGMNSVDKIYKVYHEAFVLRNCNGGCGRSSA